MSKSVIIDAVRSPIGLKNGNLVGIRPDDLAAQVVKGLMHRKSLDSDSGMLFIYPKERLGSFWMKNTLVPLAIAFIDDRGTIIEILHGKPLDVTLLTPSHPYLTVLEVNEGWFSNRNISVGAKVSWK